jgi:hypothetical protein
VFWSFNNVCFSACLLKPRMHCSLLLYSMYSQALRAEIDKSCKDFKVLTPNCLRALSEMETQIGNFDGGFTLVPLLRS